MKTVLFVLSLLASLVLDATGRTVSTELPPFTRVINCLPLSISVRPKVRRDFLDYSIYLAAEDAVVDVIEYKVRDDSLELTLSGGLYVNEPARIVVALPDTQLLDVENHNSGVLLVEPGFDLEDSTFVASAGKLRVEQVFAEHVSIEATGSSTVIVEGMMQKATVSARGIAEVAAVGVRRSADVEAVGSANIYILGGDELKITGTSQGFGAVYADDSLPCDLGESYFSRKECKPIEKTALPQIRQEWTSYLRYTGSANCGRMKKGQAESSSTASTFAGFESEETPTTAAATEVVGFEEPSTVAASTETFAGEEPFEYEEAGEEGYEAVGYEAGDPEESETEWFGDEEEFGEYEDYGWGEGAEELVEAEPETTTTTERFEGDHGPVVVTTTTTRDGDGGTKKVTRTTTTTTRSFGSSFPFGEDPYGASSPFGFASTPEEFGSGGSSGTSGQASSFSHFFGHVTSSPPPKEREALSRKPVVVV